MDFDCHERPKASKPSGIEELAPSPYCKSRAEEGRGKSAAEAGVLAAAYSWVVVVLVVRGGAEQRGNAVVAADRNIGDIR